MQLNCVDLLAFTWPSRLTGGRPITLYNLSTRKFRQMSPCFVVINCSFVFTVSWYSLQSSHYYKSSHIFYLNFRWINTVCVNDISCTAVNFTRICNIKQSSTWVILIMIGDHSCMEGSPRALLNLVGITEFVVNIIESQIVCHNWCPFYYLAGTFPIDTAKTRLQIQGQKLDGRFSSVRYNGMFHALSRIRREEGVRALYSGFVSIVIALSHYRLL